MKLLITYLFIGCIVASCGGPKFSYNYETTPQSNYTRSVVEAEVSPLMKHP